MEENVVLSNIVAIITKDLLIDTQNNLRKSKRSFNQSFPLLESSDDEATIFFMQQQKFQKKSKFLSKMPKMEPNISPTPHCTDLNLLNEFTVAEFEDFLHLSKMTFLKVYQAIRRLFDQTTAYEPPQTIFSLALWKLATDEHFEQIARKFRIPLPHCHRIIHHFWHILSANMYEFITWPSNTQQTFQTHAKLQKFHQLHGIVALQRLNVFLACEDAEVTIVLQIVCNAEHTIYNCFVELAQNYSFDYTIIGQKLAKNTKELMPEGNYLIGDKQFPLRPYLMRPFATPKTQPEITFNMQLKSALQIGQQTMEALAKRFNILYALEAKSLTEVREIVHTVCILHNLCKDIEDDRDERKPKQSQFNWPKNNGKYNNNEKTVTANANEQHPMGVSRRNNLLQELIKD